MRWSSLTCWTALGALVAVLASGPAAEATTRTPTKDSIRLTAAPQLHVSGNQLVNQHGQTVVLHGVDRSGGEFSCVGNSGIWDGPMNQSSVTAMKSWGVTAVRVPAGKTLTPTYAATAPTWVVEGE